MSAFDSRAYRVAEEEQDTPMPPVIMDVLALIAILAGLTVAVIGVFVTFGAGAATISAGVALTGLGVALAYR